MKLVALKPIPSSVGAIPAGSEFVELNPDRAADWIRLGFARDPAPEVIKANRYDWSGFEVAIIASGPSLTKEDCNLVRGWKYRYEPGKEYGAHGKPGVDPLNAGPNRRVIVINTSFRMAPFADVLYACDGRWWDEYFKEASEFFSPSQMWTQELNTSKKYGISYVKSINLPGLSKKPGVIHQGMSGGYQSIGLAVMWGAKKIYLLGVDCKGGHWHGDHPTGLNANLPYKSWIDLFKKLAPDLQEVGVEVVNCSPDSALKVFRQRDLREALCLPSAPSDRSHTTDAKPSLTDSAPPATPLPSTVTRNQNKTFSLPGTGTD